MSSITDRYRTQREPRAHRTSNVPPHSRPPSSRSSTKALWKNRLQRFFNFCATVVLSALLSMWLQHQFRQGRTTSHPGHRTTTDATSTSSAEVDQDLTDTESPAPPSSFTVGKMEDLYRKHLEEILHTLRSNPSIRLVKLRLPRQILSYQRNVASNEDGGALRLSARSEMVPMIAVSNGARRFLDQSLVTYVDPHSIPARLFSTAKLPFSLATLNNFLLIPDLSGPNAGYFSFEH